MATKKKNWQGKPCRWPLWSHLSLVSYLTSRTGCNCQSFNFPITSLSNLWEAFWPVLANKQPTETDSCQDFCRDFSFLWPTSKCPLPALPQYKLICIWGITPGVTSRRTYWYRGWEAKAVKMALQGKPPCGQGRAPRLSLCTLDHAWHPCSLPFSNVLTGWGLPPNYKPHHCWEPGASGGRCRVQDVVLPKNPLLFWNRWLNKQNAS